MRILIRTCLTCLLIVGSTALRPARCFDRRATTLATSNESLEVAANAERTEDSAAAAKAALRAAMARHGARASHPEVAEAVEALAALNPTPRPAASPLLRGDWVQTSDPEFVGGLGPDEDGLQRYTLGRLSFGMFKPEDLVCSISQPRNPVADRGGKIDYSIVTSFSFKAATGERLRATLATLAECEVASDTRLSIKFLGGELVPGPGRHVVGEAGEAWRATFGEALVRVGKRERMKNWLLKRLMGLTPPRGMARDGSMAYALTKSPGGAYLEVLYLDDDLRITKGNRGTVVVCERA